MSTIHEYRQTIDRKLDYLEMEAQALEDDLHHTREQVFQKYEGLKTALRDALVNVKQKVKNYHELTDTKRRELIAKIDEIQVGLAQGRADSEQKIKEQTHHILSCLKSLEKDLDACLKHKSSEFTEHMLKASDKLEAEFAALEVYFSLQCHKAKENFQKNKEKLMEQLHKFNSKFAEIQHFNAEKSAKFEKEFSKGLKTIKNSFLHLMD
ncbi:hypothetical protein E3226_003150 [Legionella geestiana]|uniref:hypothetical protein n=1 Tax=Legionella geestiana TaxID=45065 RepID=UPI00109290A8|nr:hypothetical protein [Legionella geestiana]QDQ39464.1 hypothetical protein E3226_003150 [Legionella geestiana]